MSFFDQLAAESIRSISSYIKTQTRLLVEQHEPNYASTPMSKVLDELEMDGAVDPSRLEDYFRFIEQSGLAEVYDLAWGYNLCTAEASRDAKYSNTRSALRFGVAINDLPSGGVDFLEDWPRSLVPIAALESWGFAINCGVVDPGSVWSYDKFGYLNRTHQSLGSFLSNLADAYTKGTSFLDSTVRILRISQDEEEIVWE